MLKKNLLLSIGVPTYNRPNMVLGQIKELANFINNNELNELVEIVVIDNNSDYDIFDLLNSFSAFKFLKIYKNYKNIGMSKNIIKTIEKSEGLYYYFVGDDDRIDFEGMKKIIFFLSDKYKNSALVVALNPLVHSNKCFFNDLKRGGDQKFNSTLDRLQFYYIGNACSFVKLDLCKEFIKENTKVAESLPVPQAMCAAYAVIKTGEVVKINYPILRKIQGDEFDNNILSSWSILYTRVIIPREAMSRLSIAYSINLTKKNLFFRHPEIRPLNFIILVRSILMFYWFIDSAAVRNNFSSKLLETSSINTIYKNVLKLLTSNLVRNVARLALPLFYFIKLPFAVRAKSRIDQKISKHIKSRNSMSTHSWEMGDL